jgi:phosphatidylserine decarboxylase
VTAVFWTGYLIMGDVWLLGVAFLGAAVLVFTIFFFRDPDRVPGSSGPSSLLAPADGTVMFVGRRRIAIFLSIFNVHIQRAPMAGRVLSVAYRRGKFLMAFDPAAEHENERNSITLSGKRCRVVVHQVAGAIARRILCFSKKGDRLGAGERLGLIYFGSQVDLDVPVGTVFLVKKGDRVRAGQTVIGRLPSSQ